LNRSASDFLTLLRLFVESFIDVNIIDVSSNYLNVVIVIIAPYEY